RRLAARVSVVARQAAHVLHGALDRLREPLRARRPPLSALPADRDRPLHLRRRRGDGGAPVARVERPNAAPALLPPARGPARELARVGDDLPRELCRGRRLPRREPDPTPPRLAPAGA